MYVLVSGATTSVQKLMKEHPNLGVLLTPADGNKAPQEGVVWAADNSAFTEFNEQMYRSMLRRIEGRADCAFVAVPDVVANHEATLELWREWNQRVKHYGLPRAFVAQDGCDVERVPWPECEAVFIGGSTGFKLGPQAVEIVAEANLRGRWTHMGRVNSAKRIVYAAGIGCRSIDGSAFSRFALTHLRWALPLARARQLRLAT